MLSNKLVAPVATLGLLLTLTACGTPSSNALPQGDLKPVATEKAATVKVPVVTGKTVAEARAAFAGLPLKASFPTQAEDSWLVSYVESEGLPVPEGRVIIVTATEPEGGTLAHPYPAGYKFSIYQGDKNNTLADVTVAIKDANAGAAIAQANQFNEAAQPGYHYVAVEFTLTGASKTDPANVSYLLGDWSLAQADGVLIAESNSYPVLPDGWAQTYDVNDLYQGQTGSAVLIFQVPDAYTGPLLVTAYGKYGAL